MNSETQLLLTYSHHRQQQWQHKTWQIQRVTNSFVLIFLSRKQSLIIIILIIIPMSHWSVIKHNSKINPKTINALTRKSREEEEEEEEDKGKEGESTKDKLET